MSTAVGIQMSSTRECMKAIAADEPALLENIRSGWYFPGTEEIQSIRELQQELEANHGNIEELRTRNQVLQQKLRCYQALSSPIRRLPPELLSYIFTLATRWDINAHFHHQVQVSVSPIDLPKSISSVSSYWRTVALDTPTMWCNIWLFPPLFEGNMDAQIPEIEKQLQRSKDAELTYHISLDFETGGQPRLRLSSKILQTLFAPNYASRVSRLAFEPIVRAHSDGVAGSRDLRALVNSILNEFQPDLVNLRKLHIHSEFYKAPGSSTFDFRVTLHEGIRSRLTTISLEPVCTMTAMLALRAFPALVEFRLTILDSSTEVPEADTEMIELPFLRSMLILDRRSGWRMGMAPIAHFFEHLNTPSLTSFAFSSRLDRSVHGQTFARSLSSFLNRCSQTDFREFTLRGVEFDQRLQWEILQAVPHSATVICLGDWQAKNAMSSRPTIRISLFEKLGSTVKDESGRMVPVALPRLRHLLLYLSHLSRDRWDAIAQMLESRAASGLEYLYVTSSKDVHRDILGEMATSASQLGVTLHVDENHKPSINFSETLVC